MPGPSSWPCRGRPASSRRVSRAPRPAGVTPVATTASHTEAACARARPARRRPRQVARARDHARVAQHLDLGDGPAGDRRGPRGHRGQAVAAWSLDCEHRPLGRDVAAGDGLDHPGGVRGVGHDVEAVLVDPPHDDVVEHRGVVGVEQVGVLVRPAAIFPRSLVKAAWRRSSAPGPVTRTVPRWLTSNTAAPARTPRARRACPRGTGSASPSPRRGPSSPPGHDGGCRAARCAASRAPRLCCQACPPTRRDRCGCRRGRCVSGGCRPGRRRRRAPAAAGSGGNSSTIAAPTWLWTPFRASRLSTPWPW